MLLLLDAIPGCADRDRSDLIRACRAPSIKASPVPKRGRATLLPAREPASGQPVALAGGRVGPSRACLAICMGPNRLPGHRLGECGRIGGESPSAACRFEPAVIASTDGRNAIRGRAVFTPGPATTWQSLAESTRTACRLPSVRRSKAPGPRSAGDRPLVGRGDAIGASSCPAERPREAPR